MGTACAFRWSRFVDEASRTGLIVPLDHGLTSGPIAGIARMGEVARWLGSHVINGVIVHKGFAARLIEIGALGGKGLCIHLNGTTTLSDTPERKEVLTSIDAALRLGADAVSVDLVFDGATDTANLRAAGRIADEARAWQLPLLVMLKSTHPFAEPGARVRAFRQLARSMAELGATAVKLPRCPVAALDELLGDVGGDIDVFFAGGERDDDHALIDFAKHAVRSGARGFCFGRNVFQNPQPEAFLNRLEAVMRPWPVKAMA